MWWGPCAAMPQLCSEGRSRDRLCGRTPGRRHGPGTGADSRRAAALDRNAAHFSAAAHGDAASPACTAAGRTEHEAAEVDAREEAREPAPDGDVRTRQSAPGWAASSCPMAAAAAEASAASSWGGAGVGAGASLRKLCNEARTERPKRVCPNGGVAERSWRSASSRLAPHTSRKMDSAATWPCRVEAMPAMRPSSPKTASASARRSSFVP
mmetsp:Transcript_52092/g.151654  ORF Transcript_52092/g.151654 Transcript_52092/m.151654 type:complete len:210 (+) Transcript_52092:20-649(+)